jgi:MoaA/NifB/PqqE/SkfB family radical SAM enzyme
MNKDFLLKDSETFCILPWIHMMMIPNGSMYPCCMAEINYESKDPMAYGSVTDDFDVTINNEKFKQLRLNMLNEVKSPTCNLCYKTAADYTLRGEMNRTFEHVFDETVPLTNEDGSIDNFKMRYVDFRFSNVCNFKCRMCGPAYSSSWPDKHIHGTPTLIKPDDDRVLEKLLEHIDYIEDIYFAGGEPLLMDEHYILLEELIRRGKTNVQLRYSTNASKLTHRGQSVIELWKHFPNIRVVASIDHYGDRAEYIRTGTVWGTVEENLKTIQSLPNVFFSISNTITVYNYLTLHEFYDYMIKAGIIQENDIKISHHICYGPPHTVPMILPKHLKKIGSDRLRTLPIDLSSQINAVEAEDIWEVNKENFMHTTKLIDKARGESFVKVFPELAEMME